MRTLSRPGSRSSSRGVLAPLGTPSSSVLEACAIQLSRRSQQLRDTLEVNARLSENTARLHVESSASVLEDASATLREMAVSSPHGSRRPSASPSRGSSPATVSSPLLGSAPTPKEGLNMTRRAVFAVDSQYKATLACVEPTSAEALCAHLEALSEVGKVVGGSAATLIREATAGLRAAVLREAPDGYQLSVLDLISSQEAATKQAQSRIAELEAELHRVHSEDKYADYELLRKQQGESSALLRRRQDRADARAAKETIKCKITTEILLREFSGVDFFGFIRVFLHQKLDASATLGEITDALKAWLAKQVMIKGGAHPQAVTDLAKAVLVHCHRCFPQKIQVTNAEPEREQRWRLKDRNLVIDNKQIDSLEQKLALIQSESVQRAATATRVLAGYNTKANKSGEESQDETESEDETDPKLQGVSKKTQIRNLRIQLQRMQEEKEYYEGALIKARDYIDLLRKENTAINEKQAEEYASLQDALQVQRSKFKKLGIRDRLMHAVDQSTQRIGAEEPGSHLSAQLLKQQDESLTKVEALMAKVAGSTPRPNFEDPEMADALLWLETAGLSKDAHSWLPGNLSSTHNWVVRITKALANAMEQNAALQETQRAGEAAVAKNEHHGTAPKVKYLQGRGVGSDIPAYLRWKGKLTWRPISKHQLEVLIKQVWDEKEGSGLAGKEMSMDDHLLRFLQSRFGEPELVATWAYNMLYSMEAHKQNSDIELFYEVLHGRINEAVYHEQQATMKGLREAIEKLDMSFSGHLSGRVELQDLVQILRQHFPLKSEDEMTDVVASLRRTLRTNLSEMNVKVKYPQLFVNKESFSQTCFVETLHDQHFHAFLSYRVELLEVVAGEQFYDARIETAAIGLTEAANVIKQLDPGKSVAEVEQLLARAAGIQKFDATLDVEAQTLLSNLGRQFLHRVSKPTTTLSESDSD